eukprot:4926488-Amphidinium_carterae.1
MEKAIPDNCCGDVCNANDAHITVLSKLAEKLTKKFPPPPQGPFCMVLIGYSFRKLQRKAAVDIEMQRKAAADIDPQCESRGGTAPAEPCAESQVLFAGQSSRCLLAGNWPHLLQDPTTTGIVPNALSQLQRGCRVSCAAQGGLLSCEVGFPAFVNPGFTSVCQPLDVASMRLYSSAHCRTGAALSSQWSSLQQPREECVHIEYALLISSTECKFKQKLPQTHFNDLGVKIQPVT